MAIIGSNTLHNPGVGLCGANYIFQNTLYKSYELLLLKNKYFLIYTLQPYTLYTIYFMIYYMSIISMIYYEKINDFEITMCRVCRSITENKPLLFLPKEDALFLV